MYAVGAVVPTDGPFLKTLRKWETTERQRRKTARESTSTTASTSLMGDITQRASLLWGGKRSRPPVQGVGAHHIIPSSEDGVAMDDLENDTTMPITPDPENPFRTPMASMVSLNTPDDPAIMTEVSDVTAHKLSDSLTTPTEATNGKSRPHPPPQPLDIPQPRSPPPRSGTPTTNTPPELIAPPTVTAGVHEEELPEKRWWTDWLCGCRERHDDQVSTHVRYLPLLHLSNDFDRLAGRIHLNNHFVPYPVLTPSRYYALAVVVAHLYPYYHWTFCFVSV